MVSKKIKTYICMIGLALVILTGKNVYAAGITDGQVVGANKSWKIAFNQNVTLDDLTKQGISVQDSNGNSMKVSIELGSDGKSILVSAPEGGYKSGESYTLTLNDKIHTDKNVKLKNAKTMHFSIEKAVEPSAALHVIYSSHYKKGLIDSNGKVIIEPKYDEIKMSDGNDYSINSDDNNPIIVSLEGKYGLIDKTGKVILEPKYDDMYGFSDGLAKAEINDQIVFIDTTGKVVLQTQYKEVGNFNNGLASFKDSSGRYGFIDKTGKVIIQAQFDNLSEDHGYGGFQFQYNFYGNYAVVIKDGKFGVIDKSGNYKIQPDSNFKVFVSDNVILVGLGDKGYKYIDTDGNTLFTDSDWPVSSGMACEDLYFENGFAAYFKNGTQEHSYLMGLVDEKGKVILDAKYDFDAPQISDGMALLEDNNKYLCLNTDTGSEFYVDAKYVSPFREGLARVYVDGAGNSYYIDKTGKKVLQPDSSFDGIGNFENGLAEVSHNGKNAYIDKTGKIIWQQN